MRVTFKRYNDGTLYSTVEAEVENAHQLQDLLNKLDFYLNFKDCLDDFNRGEATYKVDTGLSKYVS